MIRAIALALLLSGCSYFSHSPGGYRLDRGKPTCSPTPGFVGDTALAVFGLALAFSGIVHVGCEAHAAEGLSDCQKLLIAGSVVAAPTVPASIIGGMKVARCRSAWGTYDRASDAARAIDPDLIVELRGTAAVIVTGRGSETCADKPFAAELTRLGPRLASSGVATVECRAGEELIWSTPVDQL